MIWLLLYVCMLLFCMYVCVCLLLGARSRFTRCSLMREGRCVRSDLTADF